MDRRGRPDCGSDGLYLSGRLVTFVLEHIDTEAHRGVFVYMGERVGSTYGYCYCGTYALWA